MNSSKIQETYKAVMNQRNHGLAHLMNNDQQLVTLRQLCGINVGKDGDRRLRVPTKLLRIG